jgi:hypothetical protein
MNKTIFQSLFLLFSLSIGIVSCEKDAANDNTGNDPSVTLINSGFLCTIGTNRDSRQDTLTVAPVFGAGGQHLIQYFKGKMDPKEELAMVTNSNNTVTIKLKKPSNNNPRIYLGLFGSNFPPDNLHYFSFYYTHSYMTKESIETQFIIKRNPSNQNWFTLESKAKPGYFLSAIDLTLTPNDPSENTLAFLNKGKEFYFVAQ